MKKYQINVEDLMKTGCYPNEEAMKVLKSMMKRYVDSRKFQHKLQIKFCVDRDGYDSAFVESGEVAPFKVRINEAIFQGLIKYLLTGEIGEEQLNPMELEKSESKDSNSFNTDLFKMFVENASGNIQIVPAFRDRIGKLSAIVSFRYGNISFHIDRTDEVTDFLNEKGIAQ